MTFHFPRWDMLVPRRVLHMKAKRGPKKKHTYIWSHVEIYMIWINKRYCWWTKSCTSWEILNIPLFTRFCTSQVVQDFVRQQYDWFPCFTKWHICFWVMDTHWLRWTPALQTSVLKIGGLLSRLWHTIYIYISKKVTTHTHQKTHPRKKSILEALWISWMVFRISPSLKCWIMFRSGWSNSTIWALQDGCPWQENRICRVYHLEVEKYPTPKCWGLLGGYMIGLCTRGMWDLVLFETLNSTRYEILWTRGFCDVLWCPTRVFHASTKPRGAWLLIATGGCSYPWCFNEFDKWAIFHLSPLPTHSIHGTGRSTYIYQM